MRRNIGEVWPLAKPEDGGGRSVPGEGELIIIAIIAAGGGNSEPSVTDAGLEL